MKQINKNTADIKNNYANMSEYSTIPKYLQVKNIKTV